MVGLINGFKVALLDGSIGERGVCIKAGKNIATVSVIRSRSMFFFSFGFFAFLFLSAVFGESAMISSGSSMVESDDFLRRSLIFF